MSIGVPDRRSLPGGGGRTEFQRNLGSLLAETVGRSLAVDPCRLALKGRGDARTAFARHIAIYLACTQFGISLTEAGAIFGRDRTTAAYACRRIEEERDESALDHLVEQIGATISARLGATGEREGRA